LISTREELRRYFRLDDSTDIISLSVEKDKHLELFWQHLRERRYAEHLANLGLRHISAPNFSFALDVPRPEHIVNRARSLRCAEEFTRVGLSVIIHLNAYNQSDWNFWRDFLKEHSKIKIVALEFQTGLTKPQKAKWHAAQLKRLQQSLGRGLEVLAAGGRRHLHVLTDFSAVSIVDSVPFIRTMKRRRLGSVDGKWVFHPTHKQESLHDLLQHNISAYSELVRNSYLMAKECRATAPKMPTVAQEPDPRQLAFCFKRELLQSA
jgi:hypothetical protein